MSDHMDLLQRVLPLLKDAHRCVSGLPYPGTAKTLRIELGLAFVKVDEYIRKRQAESPHTSEDRLAFDMALETVVAMDNGEMPFDEQVYGAARAFMIGAIGKGIDNPRPPKSPKRVTHQ